MKYSGIQMNNAAEETEQILRQIKEMPIDPKHHGQIMKLLRCAVCCRLMVPEEEADTDDLRKLCILSIRRQSVQGNTMNDEKIEKHIEKYDCHQTNLVTQKKVLLLMYIEKRLGFTCEDEEAASVETIQDLAEAYISRRRKHLNSCYAITQNNR